MKKIIILGLFLSLNAAANSCFYDMSEREALTAKKLKLEALTLVYDITKCSDATLISMQSRLLKESKRNLSYLKNRFDQANSSSFLGLFGNMGQHGDTKDSYDLNLARIQSTLAMVNGEISRRNL